MHEFLRLQPTLNLAAARAGLNAAEAEAARRGIDCSIAVTDASGHLLAFVRSDRALLVTIDAAIEKARTAAQAGVPTRALQELVDRDHPSLLAVRQLTSVSGGYPVSFQSEVIGGIGASGGSLEEDEAVVRAGAEAIASTAPDERNAS